MGIQDGKIQFGHILLDKEIGFEKFKEMYCEYIVEECKGGVYKFVNNSSKSEK